MARRRAVIWWKNYTNKCHSDKFKHIPYVNVSYAQNHYKEFGQAKEEILLARW
jgi:hypothetical protein